jgi:hypothetical protein
MFHDPRRDDPDSGQCPHCGTTLNGPVRFCPECGANQRAAASKAAAHRSRTQYYAFGGTAVFALVFAAFGISHRNLREHTPEAQAIQGSAPGQPHIFAVPGPGQPGVTAQPVLASVPQHHPLRGPSSATHRDSAGQYAASHKGLSGKHTYARNGNTSSIANIGGSHAGDVQVITLPVTVKPSAGTEDAPVPAVADAQAMPPVPGPEPAAYSNTTVQPAPTARQPEPRAYTRVPPSNRPAAAAAPPQDDVAQQESMADDEAVYDAPPARAAQVYSTQGPQYAQPQGQYAPPSVAPRPPPQQYGYVRQPVYAPQPPVYAQRPAYAPPRPAYYAPPAPWDAQYQPQPQARWVYWSPQYGRWVYY